MSNERKHIYLHMKKMMNNKVVSTFTQVFTSFKDLRIVQEEMLANGYVIDYSKNIDSYC